MTGRVRVTVIATGFDKAYRRERREHEEVGETEAPQGFDVPSEVLEVPSFLRP
jgi:cell division GTPase FtsZ